MANYHSDPTANAAIGAVDKELKIVHKVAKKLRELRRNGLLTPEMEERARSRFIGFSRQVFENAMLIKDDEPSDEEEGSTAA